MRLPLIDVGCCVLVGSLLVGCLEKGDTIVNAKDNAEKDEEADAGRPGPRDQSEPESAPSPAEEPEPEGEPVAEPEPAPEPEPNSGQGGTPGAGGDMNEPEGPSAGGDTANAGAASGGAEGGEPEPPSTVTCADGETPAGVTPVQLTSSPNSKQGLNVVAGEDGYFVTWRSLGTGGRADVEYQGVDADLEPLYDVVRLPDGDSTRDVDVAYVASQSAYALAYDLSSQVYVSLIDADGVEMGSAIDTELAAYNGAVHVAASGNSVLVTTMLGTQGCVTTPRMDLRFVNLNTEVSAVPSIPGPCVYDTPGTLVDPSTGDFGIIMRSTNTGVSYVTADGEALSTSLAIDPEVDTSQGVVFGMDGIYPVMATPRSDGDVSYVRIQTSGEIVGNALRVRANGPPVSLAVGEDAVGVVTELSSSVEFFAIGAGSDDFVQEPVLVAAEPDLVEPKLATLGPSFNLFYIAPDEDGIPQVFAAPIPCAQ